MKKFILILLFSSFIAGCTDDPTADRPDFETVPETTNPGGTPTTCLAVDTDGDGLINCEDPDIDNDGVLNNDDLFPQDELEWADTDLDGVGDNSDAFPNSSEEQSDNDGDGIGDNSDPDNDNDGVPNGSDSFSIDILEYYDIDFDSLGHNFHDPDIDNDGIPNNWEDLKFDRRGGFDIDGDKIPVVFDSDIDGDGAANIQDAFIYDSREQLDTDFDLIGNNADPDDDNDSIPDQYDGFPLLASGKFDSDSDGFSNTEDVFPYDPAEWEDTDNDGVGNNADAFPTNPFETKDTDSDGTGDNEDQDIDGDGIANSDFYGLCEPTTPLGQESCESGKIPFTKDFAATPSPVDANWRCDGDPNNPNNLITDNIRCESLPGCYWDSGAAGDPADPNCKENILEQICSWNNTLDSCEVNSDLDGLARVFCSVNKNSTDCGQIAGCQWNAGECLASDSFPFDGLESADLDNDGLGDSADPDDDNDGFPDIKDDFSKLKVAWFDFDGDGIYDWQNPLSEIEFLSIPPNSVGLNYPAFKADPDSDNDGIPDQWDTFIFNIVEFSDIDGDGIGDKLDSDDDGDGVSDALDSCPSSQDGFFINLCQYDPTEFADSDQDSLGNNSDYDDDGDGVPDIFDDLPLNALGYSDFSENGIPDQVSIDIDGDFFPNYDIVCVSTPGPVDTCTYSTTEDLFIWDDQESSDFDSDFIGDNADPDDDNDGIPDQWDDLLTVVGSFDIDNDNEDNSTDPDIDGDGVDNINDLFIYDSRDFADNDGDGIGDNQDPDDDNDGVLDINDDFPNDPVYSSDVDGDQIPDENDTIDGIDNELELEAAILNNQLLAITSSFSITKCHTLSGINNIISSTKFNEKFVITYSGPNNDCMFDIGMSNFVVKNIELRIESGSSNIVMFESSINISSFLIDEAGIIVHGNNSQISNFNIENLYRINKSTVLTEVNNIRDPLLNNFINIGLATGDNRIIIEGSIFYTEFNSNSGEVNFIKSNSSFKDMKFFYNHISFVDKNLYTQNPNSSFFRGDYLFDSGIESEVFIAKNIINQDFGLIFDIEDDAGGPLLEQNVVAFDNEIFEATSLGSIVLDTDYRSGDPLTYVPSADLFGFSTDIEGKFYDYGNNNYRLDFYQAMTQTNIEDTPVLRLVDNPSELTTYVFTQDFNAADPISIFEQNDAIVIYLGGYRPALDVGGN